MVHIWFRLEGQCSLHYPAINGNPISSQPYQCLFILTTAPGTTGTPVFLKSFFISDLIGFLQIFWLSPEDINCSRSAQIPIPIILICDSIRSVWSMLVKRKATARFTSSRFSKFSTRKYSVKLLRKAHLTVHMALDQFPRQ